MRVFSLRHSEGVRLPCGTKHGAAFRRGPPSTTRSLIQPDIQITDSQTFTFNSKALPRCNPESYPVAILILAWQVGATLEKMHFSSCRWGGFSEFGSAKAFGGKTEGYARQMRISDFAPNAYAMHSPLHYRCIL